MSWISIHEEVLGGKLRILANEIDCSQNEALGILNRLWLWGIKNANAEGMIIGADKRDLSELLTIGKLPSLNADRIVESLIKTGWIDEINGDLYIHDWEDHQKFWYKRIERQKKDAERKRRERVRNREKLEPKMMESKIRQFNETKPVESLKKKDARNNYGSKFEEFWNEYPRKVGKGDAYKKYCERIKSGWSPEELKQAATEYARACERQHTEKQYIKHPKTFLGATTPFEDYLKKSEKKDEVISMDPYAEWR